MVPTELDRLTYPEAAAVGRGLALLADWLTVRDWGEESRYKRWAVAQATALIDAIRDPNHGVLQWVKGHW